MFITLMLVSCRTFHFPYPYNDKYSLIIQQKVEQHRATSKEVKRQYKNRLAEEREQAKVQLKQMQHNLAETIDQATAEYSDFVLPGLEDESAQDGLKISGRTHKVHFHKQNLTVTVLYFRILMHSKMV